MQPFDSVSRLEHTSALDRPAGALAALGRLVRPRAVRDVLHGVWLGHPLHPVLVQVPVGAWSSAAVLDLLPRTRRAADTLVAVGLAGAVPAAAAGLVDLSVAMTPQRRVGVVHAGANVVAVSLYAASLAARLRGQSGRGRLLGWAGLGAASVGGLLGGHLAYRQGTGANAAAPIPHVFPARSVRLGRVGDIPEDQPVRRDLDGVPLLVHRRGDDVRVLAARCSHESGPLPEGRVQEIDGEPCVECPWHGSVFRLRDGAVVHGPATAAQPAFDVDVRDGDAWVRLRSSS